MPGGYHRIYIFRNPRDFSHPPSDYEPFGKLKKILALIVGLYVLDLALSGTQTMKEKFFEYLVFIPFILFSLSFHEFAHAWMADFLGDHTPRHMGRLSLDPRNHLDFLGTLLIVFTNFGWAKPVLVNPENFRIPDRAMMSVALAGPLSNIFLAVLGGGLLSLYATFNSEIPLVYLVRGTYIGQAITTFIILNLGLAFFNLIPIHPLDGHKVLNFFLSPRMRFRFQEFETFGPIILLFLVSFGLVGRLLEPLIGFSFGLILKIVGFQ